MKDWKEVLAQHARDEEASQAARKQQEDAVQKRLRAQHERLRREAKSKFIQPLDVLGVQKKLTWIKDNIWQGGDIVEVYNHLTSGLSDYGIGFGYSLHYSYPGPVEGKGSNYEPPLPYNDNGGITHFYGTGTYSPGTLNSDLQIIMLEFDDYREKSGNTKPGYSVFVDSWSGRPSQYSYSDWGLAGKFTFSRSEWLWSLSGYEFERALKVILAQDIENRQAKGLLPADLVAKAEADLKRLPETNGKLLPRPTYLSLVF